MEKSTYLFARLATISLLATGSCFQSFAQDQPSQLPETNPSGIVNLTEVPAGITGFEILGEYTINRMFDGYVDCYRDGELVRQLPACNPEFVNTGYTEGEAFIKTDNSNLQLHFWKDAHGPTSYAGEYRIVVPEGYVFTDKECTQTNPEWVFSINCVGGSSSAVLTFGPTPDKTYQSLQSFTVTLPDNPKYRFASPLPTVTVKKTFPDEVTYTTTGTVEGNVATFTTTEPITANGTYHISYPNGFYHIDKGTDGNSDWSAGPSSSQTYYIAALPNGLTVSPKPNETYPFFQGEVKEVIQTGRKVKKFVLFTVTMEDNIRLLTNQTPKLFECDKTGQPSGDPVAVFGTGYLPEESKNVFYIVSQNSVEEDPDGGNVLLSPGEYTLVIPAQSYYTTEGYNAEFSVNYTVGVNEDFKVVLKPLDGSESRYLQYITITYDEGTDVYIAPNAYAHLSNGIAEYALSGTLTDGLTNEVTFSLPFPMTHEGKWKFTTPNYNFTVNGATTSLNATFTVNPQAPVDDTMSVDPLPGTYDSLQVFNISFPAFPELPIGQEGGKISFVKKGDTEDEEIAIPVKYYDYESKSFFIDLESKIVKKGTYVLSIADNTFWVGEENGFPNRAASFSYEVTGTLSIDDITQSDDNPAEIYDATGIIIKKNALRDDLENLPKGLYIYKGQKIIIK